MCVSRRWGVCSWRSSPAEPPLSGTTEPTSLGNIPCHWHSSFFIGFLKLMKGRGSGEKSTRYHERDRAFLFMFGEASNRRRAGGKRWEVACDRRVNFTRTLREPTGNRRRRVRRGSSSLSYFMSLEASSLSRPRSKVSEHRLEQELWWILNGCNNVLHFVTRRLLIMTDEEKWCFENEIEEHLLFNIKKIDPNIKNKLFAQHYYLDVFYC